MDPANQKENNYISPIAAFSIFLYALSSGVFWFMRIPLRHKIILVVACALHTCDHIVNLISYLVKVLQSLPNEWWKCVFLYTQKDDMNYCYSQFLFLQSLMHIKLPKFNNVFFWPEFGKVWIWEGKRFLALSSKSLDHGLPNTHTHTLKFFFFLI